jgi:hypothetical protein
MSQQFQFSSRSGRHGERLWLSTLVATMEQISRPARTEPCDTEALKTLRTQLALPARPCFASPFSLRN